MGAYKKSVIPAPFLNWKNWSAVEDGIVALTLLRASFTSVVIVAPDPENIPPPNKSQSPAVSVICPLFAEVALVRFPLAELDITSPL